MLSYQSKSPIFPFQKLEYTIFFTTELLISGSFDLQIARFYPQSVRVRPIEVEEWEKEGEKKQPRIETMCPNRPLHSKQK